MRPFVEQNRALSRWKFFEDTHSHSLVRMEREGERVREKKPTRNSIPFVSVSVEPEGFICPLLLCKSIFGDAETKCKCSGRKKKKKGRGAMDRGSEREREDRKRASVCVGDGRER